MGFSPQSGHPETIPEGPVTGALSNEAEDDELERKGPGWLPLVGEIRDGVRGEGIRRFKGRPMRAPVGTPR